MQTLGVKKEKRVLIIIIFLAVFVSMLVFGYKPVLAEETIPIWTNKNSVGNLKYDDGSGGEPEIAIYERDFNYLHNEIQRLMNELP